MCKDEELLKQQTKEHLETMPIARMKDIDGYGGVEAFNNNVYKLVQDGKKRKI